MSRVAIEDLAVKVKELDEMEMRRVFGGIVSTINQKSLEPGCALCMSGIVQRPEGGGEWYVGDNVGEWGGQISR